ncbi:phosphodiester glycosidase family protein [Fischerella sp. PCC 9605]|uniref:phosphodiester glycosidase family protein n=1 Tax=Fischerella sp. PCC 9605 TaxID=1173024 RepID=UPI00047990BE|nr:phosphodiester glycosidase family protein [Fischerella sp. PCC 9605]
MKSQKLLLGIVTAVISISHSYTAQALSIPSGFQPILEDTGVQVYKKDDTNGKLEYVTVVNTAKATIENLIGAVDSTPNDRVSKKTLSNFWQDAVNQNTSSRKAKVVVNGAFFSTRDNPTGIAFGLKVHGNLITYGYAIGKEYPGQIRTFAFNPLLGSANIQAYIQQTFNRFPEVIGLLDTGANKSASKYLPRTFVGVRDDNSDGVKETVLLYSSNYARQIDASQVLRSFGASAQAMLDGGGSTGLIVDGKSFISTNRPVPHAIAVYAGK